MNLEQPEYNSNKLPSSQNNNKLKDNQLAALFHLVFFTNLLLPLIFTPIIILIVIKAAKNHFSDELNIQWREAMNFNISILIYGLIFGILCIILIGIPLLFALIIFSIIMPIIAAIKTVDGQDYRYPYIFRII